MILRRELKQERSLTEAQLPPANEPAPEPKPKTAGAPEAYTIFLSPKDILSDAAAIESATPSSENLGSLRIRPSDS